MTPIDYFKRLSRTALSLDMMHGYQHIGSKFIYDNPNCGLFVDLGLGKTVMTLTAACRLWVDGEVNRILVIAPLKVANQVWPTEIRNWDHLYPLNYSVLTGELKQRQTALRKDCPIHIINRDNVPWLVEHFKSKWPYDMVIIDESSSFKDHKSQRFKALKKVRLLIKRMVQLTASPVAEGYHGLFAQIYLLDSGKRFGKFITHFEGEYFTYNSYSRKHTIKKDKKQEIIDKISDITLEMKAKDYLTSAGRQEIVRLVALSDEQMALYRKMAEQFVIDITTEDGSTEQVKADSAGVLATKLLQMASGVIYRTWKAIKPGTDDQVVTMRETIHLHDHKIDALEALMEELDGETAIIVYWFKSSLERLQQKFPEMVVLDKAGSQVPAWNAKKIKYLAIHPQSAGHGLNLQKGGRNMIFFDLPASLELYEQVIGRIDRQGQKLLCRIFHLVAQKTDDEKVLNRLREKRDVQDWFFARLRRLHLKVKKQLEEQMSWLN